MTSKGIEFVRENFGDGHSIWKEEGVPWSDLGLDNADKRRLIRNYESDTNDHKSTIYDDRRMTMASCNGVYLLELWSVIADKLAVKHDADMYFGRGRQAQALCAAILKEVDAQANPNQI